MKKQLILVMLFSIYILCLLIAARGEATARKPAPMELKELSVSAFGIDWKSSD